MDALGGLAPLAGELAGQGCGNGDQGHGKPADFVDDSHGKSDGDGGKTNDGGTGRGALAIRSQTRLRRAPRRRPGGPARQQRCQQA